MATENPIQSLPTFKHVEWEVVLDPETSESELIINIDLNSLLREDPFWLKHLNNTDQNIAVLFTAKLGNHIALNHLYEASLKRLNKRVNEMLEAIFDYAYMDVKTATTRTGGSKGWIEMITQNASLDSRNTFSRLLYISNMEIRSRVIEVEERNYILYAFKINLSSVANLFPEIGDLTGIKDVEFTSYVNDYMHQHDLGGIVKTKETLVRGRLIKALLIYNANVGFFVGLQDGAKRSSALPLNVVDIIGHQSITDYLNSVFGHDEA